MFVVFEGIDGSGKSTQAQLLLEHLSDRGKEVILTREPGGTPFAESIREILLNTKLGPKEQFLLILSARYNHYYQKILPLLLQKKIVICDRFILSTFAYQGYGMGLDLNFIKNLHAKIFTENFIYPHLTMILDIEYKSARKNNEDVYEQENYQFYEKVICGYRNLANKHNNILLINGNQNIEVINKRIVKEFCDVYTKQI